MVTEGKNYKYRLIIEGALIGLITGALISVFRLMLTYADKGRGLLAEYAASSLQGKLVLALLLIAIASVVTALLIWEPDIAGSGIPQTEAELRGQKEMNWYKVIIGKLAGCALAIGGGLALGREGPSVQLGAMVGKGFARTSHRPLTEERLLVTCGAGAGLSAAFGAPLAGAIFSLEEMHRNFSADILLTTMAASVASDFICANVLGLTPVFGLDMDHSIPLKYYWAVILLGIILGLFGALYNKTIDKMQDVFEQIGNGISRFICRVTGKEYSIIRAWQVRSVRAIDTAYSQVCILDSKLWIRLARRHIPAAPGDRFDHRRPLFKSPRPRRFRPVVHRRFRGDRDGRVFRSYSHGSSHRSSSYHRNDRRLYNAAPAGAYIARSLSRR